MKCCIVSSIVLLSLLLTAFAEPPDTLWTRTWGGTGPDFGRKVIQTSDGGFAVFGHTASFGAGGCDYFLTRTDGSGDTLWTRTYGGSLDEISGGICQTSDGGFILSGNTASFGARVTDIYLVKTDSGGDTLWTKIYRMDDDDNCTDISSTLDGGYILTGFSSSTGSSGAYDVILLKTDSQGNMQWVNFYGGENSEYAYSVIENTTNEFVAVGESGSFILYDYEAFILKTSADGDSVWMKNFGGFTWDKFNAIVGQWDDGFACVGNSYSFTNGYNDIYLVRTDSEGFVLWTKVIGGEWDDVGLSLAKTSDNGFIISGTTKTGETPYWDGYLVKVDSNGDTMWTCTYKGQLEENDDYLYSVKQTSDGGYIAAGETDAFGAGGYDQWMIRLEPEEVSVKERGNNVAGDCVLFTPYPNPFNQSVKLSFQIASSGAVKITLFDIAGREVCHILHGYRPAGVHSLNFNAEGLSSGVYLVRLETEASNNIQKILLLK